MPLLTMLMLCWAAGVGVAYMHRRAFMLDTAPVWQGTAFLAFMIYVGLCLLPAALYFSVLHGDWFVSYLVDAGNTGWLLPVVFIAVVCASAGGFTWARNMIRQERADRCKRSVVTALAISAVGCLIGFSRVMQVGYYRQYQGDFGLTPFFQSSAFAAVVSMGALLCVGLFLLVRTVRDLSET